MELGIWESMGSWKVVQGFDRNLGKGNMMKMDVQFHSGVRG